MGAALLVALPGPVTATVHTDTCVELGPTGHKNLPSCPVAHTSSNPYASLERSHHKYILLTQDNPITLDVTGPGTGLRLLFLWKYKDGIVAAPPGASYKVTVIRDGREHVSATFPIRPYPKHPGYGSAERTRHVMPSGKHTFEVRISSDTPGDAVFYWKVAPIAGRHLLDDWKAWPTN